MFRKTCRTEPAIPVPPHPPPSPQASLARHAPKHTDAAPASFPEPTADATPYLSDTPSGEASTVHGPRLSPRQPPPPRARGALQERAPQPSPRVAAAALGTDSDLNSGPGPSPTGRSAVPQPELKGAVREHDLDLAAVVQYLRGRYGTHNDDDALLMYLRHELRGLRDPSRSVVCAMQAHGGGGGLRRDGGRHTGPGRVRQGGVWRTAGGYRAVCGRIS